jgi:hypothetical protein
MLLLLDRIQKRATVTYGEIARVLPQKLGLGECKVFPTHIGGVAGTLMDRIQDRYPKAPLINTLIVNQDTGLPSKGCYGYLDDLLGSRRGTAKRMPRAKRTRLIHGIWEDVFAYHKWPTIFEGVFGHPPRPALEGGLESFTEEDGRPVAWGGRGGGESRQHKRLKQHLLENPRVLGLQPRDIKSKTTEQKLLSGDSVDVFFSSRETSYLVEVKSILSSDDDIKRGIYQCLKYRVILAAQQIKDPNDGSVVATLVTEREAPSDLVELAKRLAVKIYIVRVNP